MIFFLAARSFSEVQGQTNVFYVHHRVSAFLIHDQI